MFVTGASIVYSASDLAAAARCEYALLRDVDAKLGWGPAVDVEDGLFARTVALGNEHERRELDRLRDEFGDAVAIIGRLRVHARRADGGRGSDRACAIASRKRFRRCSDHPYIKHSSAKMTLDTYADLFDDDLEAVATALHDARSRESVGKMWARGGHGTASRPTERPPTQRN